MTTHSQHRMLEASVLITERFVSRGKPRRVESQEGIDMAALQARDPILFYDEVVLYEDELDDSGISLLTAKVRVMPTCWFLLLRFLDAVDGALLRLRDTRMFCGIQGGSTAFPVIIRERNFKEDTFEALGFTFQFS